MLTKAYAYAFVSANVKSSIHFLLYYIIKNVAEISTVRCIDLKYMYSIWFSHFMKKKSQKKKADNCQDRFFLTTVVRDVLLNLLSRRIVSAAIAKQIRR